MTATILNKRNIKYKTIQQNIPNSSSSKKKIFLFFLLLVLNEVSLAQLHMSKDSTEYIIKHSPAFSIYKDNYIVAGTTLSEPPSEDNSDTKFQFSFKQRLTNEPYIFGGYSYLIYTQKSFWDVFIESSPFDETSYNPGLLWIKPIYKNNNLSSAFGVSIEHESNGKSGEDSRSWNYFSILYSHIFSQKLAASVKVFIPFDLHENPDLMEYIGYGEGEISWVIKKDRLVLDATGRLAAFWEGKGSLQTSLSFRPTLKGNMYLTLQWWQGYGESLIDYNIRTSMLRVGVMIKPTLMRFY